MTSPKNIREVRGWEQSRLQKEALHVANSRKQKPQQQKAAKSQEKPKTKILILDTNVLLSDSSSIFKFEEHDVYIPTIVRAELDKHKKGMEDTARNSREVSRSFKSMLSNHNGNIRDGIPLSTASKKVATGKLFFQTDDIVLTSKPEKADDEILAVAESLAKKHKDTHIVILVTKDNNMYIEAKTRGINVEDYLHDMVIQDIDLLYPGHSKLPAKFWASLGDFRSWKEGPATYYQTPHVLAKKLHCNEFIYDESDSSPKACMRIVAKEEKATTFKVITDYSVDKNAVHGIVARNREQNFALNLLMDPDADLVTLVGEAGCGKTLLALAAGIIQTVDLGIYSDIIMTRAPIPVGEDIGFLPGTEKEKMDPWMGALYDNLEVLAEKAPQAISEKLKKGAKLSHLQLEKEMEKREKTQNIKDLIQVKSPSFMRGRTFLRKYVIIDEGQNLTPKQMKMLVTRAGPGTKMVILGNLSQIDTPFLNERSSGLTDLVENFKDWEYSGHIILPRGERSRLATKANEVL